MNDKVNSTITDWYNSTITDWYNSTITDWLHKTDGGSLWVPHAILNTYNLKVADFNLTLVYHMQIIYNI